MVNLNGYGIIYGWKFWKVFSDGVYGEWVRVGIVGVMVWWICGVVGLIWFCDL